LLGPGQSSVLQHFAAVDNQASDVMTDRLYLDGHLPNQLPLMN